MTDSKTPSSGFAGASASGLDGVDVIYCINLPDRKDRRKDSEIVAFLHYLNLAFVEGVDGKAYSAANPEEERVKYYDGSSGELGCLLSHLKVLRTFIESKHQVAMITEDDFELNWDIKPLLKEVFQVWNKEKNGLLLLSPYMADWIGVEKVGETKSLAFNTVTTSTFSACCYILTREFAQKCLDKASSKPMKRREVSETAITQQPGSLFLFPPLAMERVSPSSILTGRENTNKAYWDLFRAKMTFTWQQLEKVRGKGS